MQKGILKKLRFRIRHKVGFKEVEARYRNMRYYLYKNQKLERYMSKVVVMDSFNNGDISG